MEGAWRDARIGRIYEGTNEINRMLIVGMLLKKAMTGKLDLMGPGMALRGEMKEGKYSTPPTDDGLFVLEKWMITKMKKAIIMVLGSAAMKLPK